MKMIKLVTTFAVLAGGSAVALAQQSPLAQVNKPAESPLAQSPCKGESPLAALAMLALKDPGQESALAKPGQRDPGQELPLAKTALKDPGQESPLAKPGQRDPGQESPLAKTALKDPGQDSPLAKPGQRDPGQESPLAKTALKDPGQELPLAKPGQRDPGQDCPWPSWLRETQAKSHRSPTNRWEAANNIGDMPQVSYASEVEAPFCGASFFASHRHHARACEGPPSAGSEEGSSGFTITLPIGLSV